MESCGQDNLMSIKGEGNLQGLRQPVSNRFNRQRHPGRELWILPYITSKHLLKEYQSMSWGEAQAHFSDSKKAVILVK